MKDEKKRIKTLKILMYSCVALMFAVTLAAAFLETFESVAITIAVLVAVGMVLLLRNIFLVFENRIVLGKINTRHF